LFFKRKFFLSNETRNSRWLKDAEKTNPNIISTNRRRNYSIVSIKFGLNLINIKKSFYFITKINTKPSHIKDNTLSPLFQQESPGPHPRPLNLPSGTPLLILCLIAPLKAVTTRKCTVCIVNNCLATTLLKECIESLIIALNDMSTEALMNIRCTCTQAPTTRYKRHEPAITRLPAIINTGVTVSLSKLLTETNFSARL